MTSIRPAQRHGRGRHGAGPAPVVTGLRGLPPRRRVRPGAGLSVWQTLLIFVGIPAGDLRADRHPGLRTVDGPRPALPAGPRLVGGTGLVQRPRRRGQPPCVPLRRPLAEVAQVPAGEALSARQQDDVVRAIRLARQQSRAAGVGLRRNPGGRQPRDRAAAARCPRRGEPEDRYYETVRPCAPHRYSTPRRFRCLGHSLRPAGPTPGRHRWGDRFPRSVPMPDPNSRHLCAGHHLANQQAPARLVPGQQRDPGFDDTCTLSTFQQWFTLVRLLGPHLTPSRAPFPRRSPPRLLTAAARGGLRPPPAGRSRRAYPHHQHDTASKDHALLHRNLPQRSWHTVIGVAHQLTHPAGGEFGVEHVQVDVGQQRRDDSSNAVGNQAVFRPPSRFRGCRRSRCSRCAAPGWSGGW